MIKTCLWGLCVVAASAGLAAGQNPPAAEMLTAAQVRSLTPQQAAQGRSVDLKGVLTYCDEGLDTRFVQDGTAGIYFFNLKSNTPALTAGQMVEIKGVTSPGAYAPIIVPTSIEVLGQGNLPGANPVTGQQLVSGREDSQFVQVSGIVRSVRFDQGIGQYLIELVTDGQRFTAYAKQIPTAKPEALVDSVLRVQGVCITLFNHQRQLFGVRVLVPGAANLTVEKPAPGDPFDLPAQDLGSLLQFTPQGDLGHRVKLRGTVSYAEPGDAVFIQDEKTGVYCQTQLRTPLQPGDLVEVVGFPAQGEYSPILEDAIYRKVGQGTAPVPVTLNVDEILSGSNDCRLVQTSAKIIDRTLHGREQFLVLQQDGFTFNAYIGPAETGPGFDALKDGSDVLVSGICLIERGSGWRGGEDWRASSFRLLLRSPADLVVQGTPLIGTQFGFQAAVSVQLAVILILLLWIVVLYRRVSLHRTQMGTKPGRSPI
ncbi:MAG TPA: hypothetical protein VNU95_13620 [Candidatus Acidoferrales bacterium]|jgi:hypothetical protein|nr:hypothetical protein [Candidatus Acidoferrales bacterium]